MAESRFHIAEWYGHPFHLLSDQDRVRLARHKVGGAKMPKSEIQRLSALEKKAASTKLSVKEGQRITLLQEKLKRQKTEELACPFRTDVPHATCTKPGGVCSIRVYNEKSGKVVPVGGERGRLRALCPWRFHQDGTVFKEVGVRLLGDENPVRAGEVGFLESSGNLDSEPGNDVGRIDMILVNSSMQSGSPMDWVAVEIQAVYFSGRKMDIEFDHLVDTQGKLSMAQMKRRPDYRSSGVKRLMPQLQTKVPTLRRWGKKMAVIVDAPFFYSIGEMERQRDVSNADIVWLLVDFFEAQPGSPYKLKIVDEFYTTLESATLGLTGGKPVSQNEFEDRIRKKIGR